MRFFERYFLVVGATERNSQSRASDALVHQCIAFGMYPVSVRAGYGSCGSRSREGGSDWAACSGRGSARRSRFNHAEDVHGLHGSSSELPASALAGKVKDSRQAGSRIKSVIDDAIAQEWGTAGNPACWKGLLDKVMPRRQKLQRGITLRSLIRMKDIEGRSMAAFLYWAAAEPRTLHLARIGGTAPTLIPPPRFALDVVKQFGIGGEIAEEAG